MHFDFPGGQLFYKTKGEGTPLLILHGFGIDHSMMEEAVEPIFADSGRRNCRVYVDLPGMGKSDPLDPESYADETGALLGQFMGSLWPDRSYGLVSYSYGGYLARRLIHDYPERLTGAFFTAPVVHPMKKDRDLPVFEKRKSDPSLREKYPEQYAQFAETAVIESEYAMQMYLKTIHSVLAKRKREHLRFYQKTGYSCSIDVDRMANPFDKPSAFLLGKQDHIVGTQDALALRSCYPKADYFLLDDAGHNLFFEQKEFFEYAFVRWLERIGGK
jgi:pimeloyl-ACP methyl ester carboxylesterase